MAQFQTFRMKGFEIANVLSQFGNVYSSLQDIVSVDQIPTDPRELKLNSFLVINTIPSDQSSSYEMGHWFTLYHSTCGFEIFNSLGFSEAEKSMYLKFVPKDYFHVQTNVQKLQSVTSQTCGLFCAYFAITRSYDHLLSYGEYLNEYFTSGDFNPLAIKA